VHDKHLEFFGFVKVFKEFEFFLSSNKHYVYSKVIYLRVNINKDKEKVNSGIKDAEIYRKKECSPWDHAGIIG
jgi:hypothetical protein